MAFEYFPCTLTHISTPQRKQDSTAERTCEVRTTLVSYSVIIKVHVLQLLLRLSVGKKTRRFDIANRLSFVRLEQ